MIYLQTEVVSQLQLQVDTFGSFISGRVWVICEGMVMYKGISEARCVRWGIRSDKSDKHELWQQSLVLSIDRESISTDIFSYCEG